MRKIGRSWRVAIALLADAICVLAIGGLQVDRDSGSYYLRVSADSLTFGHLLAGIVVLYLSIVAISGRWWPSKRDA
jgi:flagellar biosynthesis protein FliR